AHWLLPDSLRAKITKIIRKEAIEPSQYTSIYEVRRFLTESPHVCSINQTTKIYFEQRYADILRNLSGTRVMYKRMFFILYYPIYALLRLVSIPGDLFTPSIRAVFRIDKTKQVGFKATQIEAE